MLFGMTKKKKKKINNNVRMMKGMMNARFI